MVFFWTRMALNSSNLAQIWHKPSVLCHAKLQLRSVFLQMSLENRTTFTFSEGFCRLSVYDFGTWVRNLVYLWSKRTWKFKSVRYSLLVAVMKYFNRFLLRKDKKVSKIEVFQHLQSKLKLLGWKQAPRNPSVCHCLAKRHKVTIHNVFLAENSFFVGLQCERLLKNDVPKTLSNWSLYAVIQVFNLLSFWKTWVINSQSKESSFLIRCHCFSTDSFCGKHFGILEFLKNFVVLKSCILELNFNRSIFA